MTDFEIYSLMNDYFIKDIKQTDSLLLFNVRQLKSPDKRQIEVDNKKDDDIPVTEFVVNKIPFPKYSKNNWDIFMLKGIIKIDPDEYGSYFERDNRINSGEKWDSMYNFHYMHNVSKPIYNPATGLVLIKDYPYKPFIACGTNPYTLYYYQRTENNSWKRI